MKFESPEDAYWYARYFFEPSRDESRQAVLSSPKWSYFYACNIDGTPRDDTRQAVLSSPEYTYRYVRNVDKGTIHPDVAKVMKPLVLTGDEWAIKLFKEFGD